MTALKGGRLRPGELDGLVLAYMRRHKNDGPLTASAIGKGIGRSSGAVANCLARLAKNYEVGRVVGTVFVIAIIVLLVVAVVRRNRRGPDAH